jgi:hypothetical protein
MAKIIVRWGHLLPCADSHLGSQPTALGTYYEAKGVRSNSESVQARRRPSEPLSAGSTGHQLQDLN